MKKKNQIARLKNIIQNDRLDYDDGFLNIFNIDLERLLKEYFSYSEEPITKISKDNNRFKVEISFSANGLKQFSVLPE